jgi:hypothetical protein
MKRVNLLIALTLILASCTILGEQPSVLDDSNCEAPCWNGIVVGVTTSEEMLAILKELPIVDQDSIAVAISPWKIYDGKIIFFLYPSPILKNRHEAYVQSNILKGKVSDIGFCGNLGTSFGNVVEKIGEPKSIIILGSPSGGSFVNAVNEDIGVQFTYDTADIPRQLRAKIAPEIPIKCLVYFAPEFYDLMLEAAQFSAGHLNAEQTLNAMRPWNGYGDLEQYMP